MPAGTTLSIPLWCDWDELPTGVFDRVPPAFNPTVVRLGPMPPSSYIAIKVAFNPTVVRLGPLLLYVQAIGAAAFNPTVVRLGPSAHRRQCPGTMPLSIPLWCDWDALCRHPHLLPSHLSIPLWCDWDGPAVNRRQEAVSTFNPTVVRLGRLRPHRLPHPEHHFQSHCGAIGTLFFERGWSTRSIFQSHCGAIGTTWRGG